MYIIRDRNVCCAVEGGSYIEKSKHTILQPTTDVENCRSAIIISVRAISLAKDKHLYIIYIIYINDVYSVKCLMRKVLYIGIGISCMLRTLIFICMISPNGIINFTSNQLVN